MPKMKSNRGAAKRFKRTGTGKFMRKKSFGSHLLTKKSPKRKRRLRGQYVVDKANKQAVEGLTPYK